MVLELTALSQICVSPDYQNEAKPQLNCFYSMSPLVPLGSLSSITIMSAPGAKPDIVVMDLQTTRIAPVYDPIKSLVNAATSDNVEKVYCDGKLLVDEGRVLGVDEEKLLGEVQKIADAEWKKVSQWDYAGRELSEYAPPSYREE